MFQMVQILLRQTDGGPIESKSRPFLTFLHVWLLVLTINYENVFTCNVILPEVETTYGNLPSLMVKGGYRVKRFMKKDVLEKFGPSGFTLPDETFITGIFKRAGMLRQFRKEAFIGISFEDFYKDTQLSVDEPNNKIASWVRGTQNSLQKIIIRYDLAG